MVVKNPEVALAAVAAAAASAMNGDMSADPDVLDPARPSTPPLRLLPTQDEAHTLTSRADLRFGPKFKVLTQTDQIGELQTLIRDGETTRPHFKFVADRLIRLVIEEGLNQVHVIESVTALMFIAPSVF